jgi:hypothetical protein
VNTLELCKYTKMAATIIDGWWEKRPWMSIGTICQLLTGWGTVWFFYMHQYDDVILGDSFRF